MKSDNVRLRLIKSYDNGEEKTFEMYSPLHIPRIGEYVECTDSFRGQVTGIFYIFNGVRSDTSLIINVKLT